MGSLLKPLAALLALAAVIGGVIFGVDYYRHRFVRSDADLVKLLPPGDLTTFFADLSLLRQAGLLNVITGAKPAADKEYREFVRQTQFDYTRDMDALAGAADGSQLFFVIRGRFDWDKLRAYALAHGGACRVDFCKAPTSTPGRWADFFPLQADVIALAVSPNNSAADLLRPPGRRLQDQPPLDPVWVKVSLSLLKDPTKLPLPVRIFAVTLQSADSVVLSAGRASGANAAFTLQIDAGFENTAAADTIRHQLDIQTRMLKQALNRENQQPNPADLTGLLTAGNFQQVEKHVLGTWPVRKELLSALQ